MDIEKQQATFKDVPENDVPSTYIGRTTINLGGGGGAKQKNAAQMPTRKKADNGFPRSLCSLLTSLEPENLKIRVYLYLYRASLSPLSFLSPKILAKYHTF